MEKTFLSKRKSQFSLGGSGGTGMTGMPSSLSSFTSSGVALPRIGLCSISPSCICRAWPGKAEPTSSVSAITLERNARIWLKTSRGPTEAFSDFFGIPGAMSDFSTDVEPHSGHETWPADACSSNASLLWNHPSKRWVFRTEACSGSWSVFRYLRHQY